MLCRHPFPTRRISSWSHRSPFTLQSLCQVFSHRREEHDQYTAFKWIGREVITTFRRIKKSLLDMATLSEVGENT